MVLSLRGFTHRSRDMNAEQRQMAANLWAKPTDVSHKLACSHLGNYTVSQKNGARILYLITLANVDQF